LGEAGPKRPGEKKNKGKGKKGRVYTTTEEKRRSSFLEGKKKKGKKKGEGRLPLCWARGKKKKRRL